MSSRVVMKATVAFYIAIFFLYLFGPLVVMGLTAFNTPTYPQAFPLEGFTTHWFADLLDDRDLMEGLWNSLIIGLGVICLAVPVGLAAAIVMTQIYWRARALYYLVVVSPVLTPGVILGISTVIFWKDFTTAAGLRSIYLPLIGKFSLYDGIFLSIVGQSTFICAYCMLIFLSRLQRFDRAQEEAALDLGASYPQVFMHILLPFLKPAILSAAVLAFLSSFENYNTTTFAILADKTLVTVLAGRVRQGTTPSLSALAVIIIAVTLIGAVLYEVLRRREERIAAERAKRAREAERQEIGTGAPAAQAA
jgi:spermidine/putrescine transport system permease protein